MAIQDGDILSALSSIKQDTSSISNNLSDMSDKDIHQINQNLETLVRLSQGTQRSNENNRFQRERDQRYRDRQSDASRSYREPYYRAGQRSSQGTARTEESTWRSSYRRRSSSSSNPFKDKFDGVVDEFLDSIGKGMKDSLKASLENSPFQKTIRGYIKKFADDLGISVSEIPSAIGRDIGKHVIQNTRFGKHLSSTLQGIQDRFLNNVLQGAKAGVGRYAQRTGHGNDIGGMYREAVERYRAEHRKDEPQGQSRGSEGPDADRSIHPSSERSESLDAVVSLLNQINDTVFAILNSIDSEAANKIDEARKPQGERRNEPPEGTPREDRSEGNKPPERSDVPEASNTQGEARNANEYDPEYDLTNRVREKVGNVQNKAKGLYDKLPDSIKSKISDKYGKYINTAKNFLGKFGQFGAGAGEASAGSQASTLALGSSGAESATTGILPRIGSFLGAGGSGAASTATAGGVGASAGIGAIGGAGMAIPQVALAMAAIHIVSKKLKEFADCFNPAIEGVKKFQEAAKKTFNRFYNSQKVMLKEEQKRIQADIETMATEPFEIMKRAADAWYKAWDEQLRKIGQTQGYTKSDVQSLYSGFAERLRAEGLTGVVSAADIADSLGSVLESGLQGKIAEEFAYKATLLNNQIPTQDFYGYASAYGQIVGNAMAKGLTESAAIQEANSHLEQFASNLIYAGRNISDGIATGLKDGSQLFTDSVNIALSARSQGDIDKISGVMTAVAAELSAIAPDLTSEVLAKIVSTATGGNSQEAVALRSMAGINASNSEFLDALAANPQQVLSAMFSGLSNMQKLNNDNYMEVAESLSQIFGLSMAAFSRIDFSGLAAAISSMQVNNAALSENLSLLKSGETTQGTEMLKMQQINQMILDEGLSYVLDNEAARTIQEHMWNQELANEIMEREYSVDFAGSAKEMIQGIFETIHNILKFLNPFSWIGDIVNLVATGTEYDAQKADLRSMLEAGKVGKGNATAFRNLTNYNGSSLNSVPSLMDMMGLFSSYSTVHTGLNLFNSLTDVGGSLQLGSQALGALDAGLATAITSYSSNVNSKYKWGFVGKSLANAIASSPVNVSRSTGSVLSSSDIVSKKQADQMNEILGTIDAAVEANKSFDQWKDEVTSQYNLTNFGDTLSGLGLSEAEVRGQFEAKEAQKVSKHNYEREQVEDEFWEKAINYFDVSFPTFAAAQLQKMDIQIDWQNKTYDELVLFHTDMVDWWKLWVDTTWKKDWVDTTWKKDWISTQWTNGFLNYWTDVFVKFDTYSKSTHNAYKAIDEVKDKDKKKESGDAVLALAKALTDNTADLKDPTIQSNALLAQILIVVEAILQAENTSGGASLQTSLSALGLGLTTANTDTSTGTTTSTTT